MGQAEPISTLHGVEEDKNICFLRFDENETRNESEIEVNSTSGIRTIPNSLLQLQI